MGEGMILCVLCINPYISVYVQSSVGALKDTQDFQNIHTFISDSHLGSPVESADR